MIEENNKQLLTRRKLLGSVGLAAGCGLVFDSKAGSVPDQNANGIGNFKVRHFDSLQSAKKSKDVQPGEWVFTAGYYRPGDGGAAGYRVIKDKQYIADEGEVAGFMNGCVGILSGVTQVHYRMFGAKGDGQNDDGVQMKRAHDFANKNKLPVEVISGEYWIVQTRNIEIKTPVYWGQSVFHINEIYNTKEPVFVISSDEAPISLLDNAALKKAVIEQLRPGVQQIEELSPYSNHLLWIRDDKDHIGNRYMESGGPKRKEELVYVENNGRLIGEVAWTFKDLTDLVAYPAERSYLTVEGGSFYLSGENHGNSREKLWYFHNGFVIKRSRTIVRNQWVGLDSNHGDIAMNPRSGFYFFSEVYDVTLENIRLVPWEYDRPGEGNDLYAGTYGIGGNRMLKTTFRNISAEGTRMHWGVFGTNMNKNFFVENCTLNRVDVHFHCWNLTIKDSRIGHKGITITGGGDLIIENTVCENNHFVNFRTDYGAKWDGNITIRNCRLRPDRPSETSVIRSVAADFNYGYPIGMGRNIFVENFIFDYTTVPETMHPCWLIRSSEFSKSSENDRSFFPSNICFSHVTVTGRTKGVRLINIPDPGGFLLSKPGASTEEMFEANAYLSFNNIQLEKAEGTENSLYHIQLSTPGGKASYDAHSLYPTIHVENCQSLAVDLGKAAVELLVENGSIDRIKGAEGQTLPGELTFSNCKFIPSFVKGGEHAYEVKAILGTSFINCTFHLPRNSEGVRDTFFFLKEIVMMNQTVFHNHLNSRLGKDVLGHLKKSKITLKKEFIERLKNHHELENQEV